MVSDTLDLEIFLPEDEAVILEILTDATVAETYMLPQYQHKAEAIPLFRRLMALSLQEDRYVRCIRQNGGAIGFLNDVEIKAGRIELGYVIHPAFQGRGYMTQALKTAIRDLHEKGFAEVICGAFEGNNASFRVMAKSGMKKSDYTDTVEYRGRTYRCLYYTAVKEN